MVDLPSVSSVKKVIKLVGGISTILGSIGLISLGVNFLNSSLASDSASQFGIAFTVFILGFIALKFS